MYDLGNHFHIDLNKLKSKPESIIKGQRFRITILTERLIRLEYSPTGVFNDFATEFAVFRDFGVPKFTKKEDRNYLEVETEYFKLVYSKEEPFKGTTLKDKALLELEKTEGISLDKSSTDKTVKF